MPMHSAAVIAMATSMFFGASAQWMPESCEKKAKYGILIPAWWKTPAEANRSTSQVSCSPSCAAALMIIDLVTKPLNSGKAEIDAAPTMQKPVVHGIDLYRPPSSLPLTVPVRSSTAPIDMKSSALNRMSAKAWATAPLTANSVPMPTPTTIKPIWLFML